MDEDPFAARRSLAALAVLACGLLAPLACVMPRFIPRHPPAPTARPAVPTAGGVRVSELTIRCRRSGRWTERRCGPSERLLELGERVGSSVEAAFPPRDRRSPPVEVAINIEAVWSSHQTGIFDALAGISFGAFPLVPQWGEAELRSRITLTTPSLRKGGGDREQRGIEGAEGPLEDTPLGRISVEVSVPYQVFWYSWYRADAPARAFDQAWKVLADQITARLGASLGGGCPKDSTTPWSERHGGEDDELRGQTTRASGAPLSEVTTLVLDRGERWRLRTKAPQKNTPRGLLRKYLSAFSGLEAGYFMGKAWVQSQATDAAGASFTIASGKATSRGYKIGFYTVPERSDWFIFPTLGFFSLDIDIHDFAGGIPLRDEDGATGIHGVGSDPATGLPVNLGDPNVYRLALRSGYLGQRLSGTLVYGSSRVQLFGTLEGGVNILEVRHTRVSLGKYDRSGYSAAWFRSAAVRGIVGIAIRPWHLALRCEANYEGYFSFSYPEAINFEGPLVDGHRPLTRVSEAAAGTANVFFSANFYY